MDAEQLLENWTPERQARLLCKADGSQKLLLKHEDGGITRDHWEAQIQRWSIDADDGEPYVRM
jgi:hypothetical protein